LGKASREEYYVCLGWKEGRIHPPSIKLKHPCDEEEEERRRNNNNGNEK
jgi:hypothetical protein